MAPITAVKCILAERLVRNALDHPEQPAVQIADAVAGQKAYTGVQYLENRVMLDGSPVKPLYVLINDVKITAEIGDPDDEADKRNEYGPTSGTRLRLSTTVSESGYFGQWISMYNDCYVAQIEDKKARGNLPPKKVRPVLQKSYVDKKSGETRIITDPTIQLDLKMVTQDRKTKAVIPDLFSPKHMVKAFQNKPKCNLFETKLVNGKEVVTPAMVEIDGKMVPVDYLNIHKWITVGSRIVKGRVLMDSVADSGSGISAPLQLHYAEIRINRDEGIVDDEMSASTSSATSSASSSSAGSLAEQLADNSAPVVSAPVVSHPSEVPTETAVLSLTESTAELSLTDQILI